MEYLTRKDFLELLGMGEPKDYLEYLGTDSGWGHDYEDGMDLPGIDLSGKTLMQTGMIGADLSNSNLSETNLMGADLRYANLTGANLTKSNLTGASLDRANLSYAKLYGAKLTGARCFEADLRSAYLPEAVLDGTIFLEADLRSADLSGAKLRNAILWSADLRDTKLGRADLCGANLRGTNLSGAKLEADKAVLLGAKYNSETKWPEGFDLRGCTPKDRGAVLESINIFEPHEQDWKKRVEETEKLVRESYITYGTESLAGGWGSTKTRGSIPLNVRQQVFRNAENRCQQCGKSASDGVKLEVDHIMPVSRGGSDDISNLELLCFECNRGKSDRVD